MSEVPEQKWRAVCGLCGSEDHDASYHFPSATQISVARLSESMKEEIREIAREVSGPATHVVAVANFTADEARAFIREEVERGIGRIIAELGPLLFRDRSGSDAPDGSS